MNDGVPLMTKKAVSETAKAQEQKTEKPHHAGHRDRLRRRFLKSGANSLADYELLELLLFSLIPRRDVKPLAKTLLARFGGFSGVLTAEVSELTKVKGVSEKCAVGLKAIHAATQKLLFEEAESRPVLSSWQSLLDYCHVAMAHEKREQLRVLFLNRKNRLIADEVQQSGTVDHTPVYPREIVRRALELGATAIILVHNHPSGDPTPSAEDEAVTRRLARAGEILGIPVVDHVVMGEARHASFREFAPAALCAKGGAS